MLHNALIRSIMAEIGTIAGVNALYWRGGLCVFDAGTRSRVLIEQEMTGDWQGEIRVRTQNGQAATLLEKAVEIVERAHARLGMRPDKVERSAPAVKTEATSAISPGPETTTTPEWYVSYAWGDDRTPEGRARQEIVDRLCDAAAAQGHRILRDTDTLSHGDSITAFMKKIGTGDRVFVILSDKYLRSPFCMFELSEVWRTSKQHKQVFLDRVRVYALPDVDISEPEHWGKWSVHWKHQYDALNAFAHKHDAVRLGEHGFRRLQQMEKFYIQVADILGALADIVQPRTFEELQRYGFGDPSTA
jgi:internalin A